MGGAREREKERERERESKRGGEKKKEGAVVLGIRRAQGFSF